MTSSFELFLEPVDNATQSQLRKKWSELPADLQTERQIYGRNEEGCGATVGVMPRCDFNCRGCYLTDKANSIPADNMDAIKRQLGHLRQYLGRWGNLQISDGEVTLRKDEELIEILRYARGLELIPMLMTHGDTFRRRPGYLEKLMTEGGLDEISLHIDVTQKGRRGYADDSSEEQLHDLRREFAELVRQACKNTGLPLRVAATVTVCDDNVDSIQSILKCLMAESDVFRLVNFLPIAQIGRTEDGLGGGISSETVWSHLSSAAGFSLDRWHWHIGHPACNRFVIGLLLKQRDGSQSYTPISMTENDTDKRFLTRFFEQFSGITFRPDKGWNGIFRALGMIRKAPRLMLIDSLPFAWQVLKRMSPRHPLLTLLRLAIGYDQFDRFTISTHHFMSPEEMDTDLGRERLEQCIFKVVDNGEMVSMCSFNGQGGRERLYQQLREQ